MHQKILLCLAGALVLPSAVQAISYDQDVTSNAIFGNGNANGGYTVDTQSGVELGLRAKVRYDVSDNQPKNIFNSNGDGTYNHAVGSPASSPLRARWNFEWSINTDVSGTAGTKLDDLTYRISMDFNPGNGTTFYSFDPINGVNPNPLALGQVVWDHSIGDNSTAQSAGVEAASVAGYAALIAGNNLAQNSWNLNFYEAPIGPYAFDPSLDGTYTFILEAFSAAGGPVAKTEIDVIVGRGAVPDASSTLPLLSMGIAGLCFLRSRQKQTLVA